MGTTAKSLVGDLDVGELADRLDELHNANLAVMLWAYAVQSRLAGEALLLLDDELGEVAEQALANTRRLSARAAEIGGEITSDPREIIARSPFDNYRLPDDASDTSAILEYSLAQVRTLISAYQHVLEMTRSRDDITYRLVVDLLGRAVTREDEIEAALDVGPGPRR